MRDKDLANSALVTGALHGSSAGQIRRCRLTGAFENRAQQVWVALHRRRHDRACIEVHAALVVSLR